MKQRISALDLQILAGELRAHLEGYRLTNIYNIADSSRQFLLKFNKPDSKLSVVVDCGLRIHLTDYDRPIPPGPSSFVVKLRKHLKSKRLTALRQVKNDRILVLQFADGLFYLVLEFFSAGNVILLDENKRILSLQRIVHEHENKVGETYTMFDDSIFLPENDLENRNEEHEKKTFDVELVKSWLEEVQTKTSLQSTILPNVPSKTKNGSKKKAQKVLTIHKLLLSREPHLSSDLLSKNLKIRRINPSTPCLDFLGREKELIILLNDTEAEFDDVLKNKDSCGFILSKKNVNFTPGKDSQDLEFTYENFHPFKPYVEEQDEDKFRIVEVQGEYNKTLDTFFSTIESSKYALRIQQQEQLAKKKLEDARLENQRKIQALVDVQSINERKGHVIIANADLVEEAKIAVQGLIDQQMDWQTIEKLIKNEQLKKNKIAMVIDLPLELKDNAINLLLPELSDSNDEDRNEGDSDSDSSTGEYSSSEPDSDSSSDESDVSDFEAEDSNEESRISRPKKDNKLKIRIDLGLSAYANASKYFTVKKTSADKQKKVEKNVEKAMKNIEQKIDKQLKQKLKESHNVLKKNRPPYFFEKHFWFISTEGFLVLMGRSALETDQIYSKYIEDDDIYMCSSFDTQVWIKNPDRTEVPPNTLMQAGIFCMAASEAWSKKISSSPLWCFAKNVTKFDHTGKEVLAPGLYRIKKESEMCNLPPTQLVMGFGFAWKVSDPQDDSAEAEPEELSDEDDKDHEEFHESARAETPVKSQAQSSVEETEKSSEVLQRFNEITLEDSETRSSDADPTSAASVSESQSVLPQINRGVRGKKGKLKKIQKKYADQDEDERQMRLQALGTLKGLEKTQLKEQEELARQQNREFKKARREKQKELQTLSFTKNEKVKVNYQKIIGELKSSPDKDEKLVDAIPVFAPWPALLKYKYKVKIQPGSAKKTKSLNDILHHFCTRPVDPSMADKEADWPREHEIIKQLKAQDLVLTVCSDKLKVTLPGQTSNGKGGKAKQKKK